MRSVYDFFIGFDGYQAFSVFLVLFAVIDVIGSTAIVINLRKRVGHIHASQATIAVGVIMISFLFVGQSILDLFGIDADSFAGAGSIILLFIGLEMILNVNIFKLDIGDKASSIVPVAFPIIADSGTLATLLTLRSGYAAINILCGTLVNLVFIYTILRNSEWIERKLGQEGFNIIKKATGVIVLSMAVKLFRTHFLSIV